MGVTPTVSESDEVSIDFTEVSESLLLLAVSVEHAQSTANAANMHFVCPLFMVTIIEHHRCMMLDFPGLCGFTIELGVIHR